MKEQKGILRILPKKGLERARGAFHASKLYCEGFVNYNPIVTIGIQSKETQNRGIK